MVKKILYVHHGKGLGGAPLSLLYLIKNLDHNKFKPIVLFLYDSEIIDLYKKNNIEVVGPILEHDFAHTKIWWYKWYHPHHLLKATFSLIKTIFFKAPSLYIKIKPDIIHLNTSSLIGFAIAAKKFKIPVICHIREPLSEGYFGIRKQFIQKIIQKYSKVIVPISFNDAGPWRNSNKIRILHNAVDDTIFSTKNITEQTIQNFLLKHNLNASCPKILFLGGLSKEKGTHVIFDVFSKIIKKIPDAKLIVCGYFDLNQTDSKIEKLYPRNIFKTKVLHLYEKIKQSLVILGPTTDIPLIMSVSDILVFPATVGHFARPIIEAGFMKKPTIGSDLPGIDELIINKKTGFLINPNDSKKWEHTLIKILQDKELSNLIGNNAFKHCSENFGMKDYIKKIENIYKEST